jgi:hypothetical protein
MVKYISIGLLNPFTHAQEFGLVEAKMILHSKLEVEELHHVDQSISIGLFVQQEGIENRAR